MYLILYIRYYNDSYDIFVVYKGMLHNELRIKLTSI